uniref:Uncharacterized protein n=1 Tax=Arundo donax TaxID=35708 RepID=A0A0A9B988_ARUDO
MILAYSNSVCN